MPGRGRPPTISRDAILQAALAIADAEGVRAVSMRAVAERLGVTPMALYRHVGDKQALLDGLIERLLQEVPLPDPRLDWAARLRALVDDVLVVARRHPGVFPLLLQRPAVTPGALRLVETIFAALAEAGIPPADIPRTERLLSTYVLGYAASEVGGRFSTGTLTPAQRRANLDPDAYPMHHVLGSHLDHLDPPAELAWSLDLIQDWVRALAADQPATPGAPVRPRR